jgi:hypothetical protein
MGGFFSGTDVKKTTSEIDTGPSKFQLPYLQDAFSGAQKNYRESVGTPFYQGPLYAGLSDQARSNLGTQSNYAMGQGMAGVNALNQTGVNGLQFQGRAGQALDSLGNLINTDATQSNIGAASLYADNPYLNSQIDAVNRDVVRGLREQTLPGINRSFSATGGINSSRAGVAEGLAMRGAQDRMADTAAQMRASAYDRGLQMAQGDRATNMNALGNLSAQYAGLTNQGIAALGAGNQIAQGNFGMANTAAALDQADRQGQVDADFNRWQGQDTRATDLLNRYYGVVGANQWGQQGTETKREETPNGGIFGKILGGAASIAGIAETFSPGSVGKLFKGAAKKT